MSILRTHNLQNPDSSSINIVMDQGGNTNITGVTTVGSNFHVTSGSVGIGTNNPSYLIDAHTSSGNAQLRVKSGGDLSQLILESTDTSGYSQINFADAGSNNIGMLQYFHSDNHMEFTVNGSEALRIDSAGRLLCGTSSGSGEPIAAFQGRSNDASDSGIVAITRTGTNPSGSIGELRFATGSDFNKYYAMIICQSDGSTTSTSLPGVLRFSTTASGSTSPTERLRITSAGRVAIGNATNNASPTAKFQVKADDGEAADLYVGQFDNLEATAGQSYGVAIRAGSNSTDHGFRVKNRANDTTQFLVRGDGNIGINDQNPGDKLSISGGNLGIYNTGNNHGNVYFYKDGTAKGWLKYRGNDDKLVIGNVTDAINVKTSGNVGVGNADPTQAKFVAQTASGMSIAAVKDNTGASISLGGVTQPRILMEAGASASQLKLYTASGSSYSSAGWRQRLHVTDTNASVASTGSGTNGIGCFGIADNIPDSRALALSIGGGNGLYGIEDPRPMVYLQRSYGVGGGSSTDEITLEISAPGSYNSAGVVYGIKSRVQHNLNGSHYAGHFEAHGSQYAANGTSALYAKTTKLDTNGAGDVIAFRADASITQGISNSGAAIAGYFSSGNNINGKPIVCLNGLTSNSWANQIIFRKHNGSGIVDVGSIKSSNTTTQYNTNSDYRLKENVISLTGAINRLKQLQPKRFNFIGVDETIDGFIAHEVTSVAPYAVSGEKDAVKKELVLDEDGKEQFDENGEIIHKEVIDPQGVDYSKLTTLTIAALQEALAKIETLEAAVAALQGA